MTSSHAPAVASRLKRASGVLGYLVFVLVAVIGVNQWQSQEEADRDARRGKFIARVCVALDDFRVATNERNKPLYDLVQGAILSGVDSKTGKPLTAEDKKAIIAFGRAYEPIPPVTNCDDPIT